MGEIEKIIGILADSNVTSYFRTGYVQRLIDYQWESKLKKAYSLILVSYCSIYAGVMIGSSFLLEDGREERNS